MDPRACRKQSLESVGVVEECSSPTLPLPPLQLKHQVDNSELAVGTLSSTCLALSTELNAVCNTCQASRGSYRFSNLGKHFL
jgi:hypothetical protein